MVLANGAVEIAGLARMCLRGGLGSALYVSPVKESNTKLAPPNKVIVADTNAAGSLLRS